MFPPDKKPAVKKDARPGGGPPSPGGGPPPHPAMQAPMGPKPGQGMNPMEAMLGGMGDMSMFAPPAPQAPMGPDGLPVGGSPADMDPGMDPAMGGSSLFSALNMGPMGGASQDPFASPPMGHGQLDPPPDLDTLLGLLAMMQGGIGGAPQGLNPSGVTPQPSNPFQVTQ